MLTKIDTTALHKSFITAEPFHHVVIDDFFDEGSALSLYNELPDFHDTLFNRAIIFDTTQRSYHGLPTPLS